MTWWFGMMAIGGVGFGFVAPGKPFGKGWLAEPGVMFIVCAAIIVATLRFLYARPVLQFIPVRALAAGIVIGIVCYLVGYWFGIHLPRMP
jgi:hypothetical protein